MAEAQGNEEAGRQVGGAGAALAAVEDAAPAAASAPDGDVVSATLAYLARALVEHPDEVRVTAGTGERGPTYHLHVHPEDMGRVIGRSGRVARAIRQVTRAAAARAGVHAFIQIGDQ